MTAGDHGPAPALQALRYRQAGPVQLYLGDARQVLAAMPAASVDSIVTSPPFWSLRDYGTGTWRGGDPTCPHQATARVEGTRCPTCDAAWVDAQYGLEPTVEQYVARLVAVFNEARRVLTPTGTLWLNLGDSYAGGHDARTTPAAGSPPPGGCPAPATDRRCRPRT